MPAKITASTTNPATGEIKVSDVNKLTDDYQTLVNLSSSDVNRNPVSKYFHFTLELDKIREILQNNPNADQERFRIYLTLNLPGQRSCDGSYSIENFLSILVCGVDAVSEPGTPLLNIGDLVLADGFMEHADTKGFTDRCCVQGGRG